MEYQIFHESDVFKFNMNLMSWVLSSLWERERDYTINDSENVVEFQMSNHNQSCLINKRIWSNKNNTWKATKKKRVEMYGEYIKDESNFTNFKYSPSTKLDGPPKPKLNPSWPNLGTIIICYWQKWMEILNSHPTMSQTNLTSPHTQAQSKVKGERRLIKEKKIKKKRSCLKKRKQNI